MTLTLPQGSALMVRATFEKQLCHFWRLRNAPDRNTRRFARMSVHHFCNLLRQLP